jgi:Flp pilus assembly pilin Flp
VRTLTLRRIARFAQGANALEYALMLILVALIILAGAGAVGTNLKEWRVNQPIVR